LDIFVFITKNEKFLFFLNKENIRNDFLNTINKLVIKNTEHQYNDLNITKYTVQVSLFPSICKIFSNILKDKDYIIDIEKYVAPLIDNIIKILTLMTKYENNHTNITLLLLSLKYNFFFACA
jgi:hypothetical protein